MLSNVFKYINIVPKYIYTHVFKRFVFLLFNYYFQVTELLDSLPGDVYRKREEHPGSANEPLLDVPPPPI